MGIAVKTLHQKTTAKEFHTHHVAQLFFTIEGVMYITAENNLYIIPPNMAIFIPKNVAHKSEMLKNLTIASLYLPDQYTKQLPKSTQLMPLTELAKALIIKICTLNAEKLKQIGGKRLINSLLEELNNTETVHYARLILPNNHQILKIYQLFRVAKGNYPSVAEAAASIHVSSRTLLRIFKKQTGISFMVWKQQFLFIKAIELLQKYRYTNTVAYKLGYNSESAFIAMFKKMSGGKLPQSWCQSRRNF